MTQDEIRKLLGGYATNALTANERQILFEAALEDQELFNALQNEDALRELLDDPISREQVRRALNIPNRAKSRPRFGSRRWLLGVAIPAVAAVILIAIMNRYNAPRLIAPPPQTSIHHNRAETNARATSQTGTGGARSQETIEAQASAHGPGQGSGSSGIQFDGARPNRARPTQPNGTCRDRPPPGIGASDPVPSSTRFHSPRHGQLSRRGPPANSRCGSAAVLRGPCR